MPNFSDVRLTSERLLLRPLRHEDAPALFAIFSDARVMRYWSSAPWESVQVSERYIERERIAMAEGKHLRLAIVSQGSQTLLGTCTLFDHVVRCRRAEVGFALAPSAWGQGYACEAVSALLSYGFGPMDLNRVEADVDPRNTASAGTLVRLGFAKEGHLRERWIVEGEVSDSAIYGMLRSDWKARAG